MKFIFAKLNNAKDWSPHKLVTSRIRRKQLAAFLVIALIPLMAMGIVSFNIATKTLMDQATEQLEGTRQLKSHTVQAYFLERRKDLEQLADTMSRLYESSADKIIDFQKQIVNPTDADLAKVMTKFVSPRLKGSKADLISTYRKQSGFENIFLISTSGYVFDSAKNGSDRFSNLLTGAFKNTNLSRLTASVIRKKGFGMADFEPYAPAQQAPAAFMAQPVLSNGEVKFVVAVQLSISQINAIASERTGLGQSGAIYLVGHDKTLRNDVQGFEGQGVLTTILNPEFKIDSEITRSALNGSSGTKITKNHKGIMTLSSWQPLTIVQPNPVNPEGVRWALLTEIVEQDIYQPMFTFAWVMAGAMGIAVLLVIGGAYMLTGGLTRQIQLIMALFSEIGMGNFNARCQVVSRDELGTLAHSLNAMLDNVLHLIQSSEERDEMQSSIMKLLTDISDLTEGDLSIRAEVTEDMTGAIADSFNTMAEQLSRLVSNVKKSTLEVTTTSRKVSETAIDMSRASDEHATQISEAVQAIGKMSESIHRVSEHASQSARVSDQAMQNALSGAEAVRETNTAMNAIRERVQEAARAIKRLGESSQEIGNIVQIINDIADRTSILALNASIQAAMAGDAGRGFAVVADEVQRLAEQSSNATKQIETLVKTIQGEINEAGTRMEDSIQKVVHGTQLADGAHTKLEKIEAVSQDLAKLVLAISTAANQQAASSANISDTMKKVGEISSQASVQGRQTAHSITNLAETSEQLRESVEVFKLADETFDEIEEELDMLDEEILDSYDDEELPLLSEAG